VVHRPALNKTDGLHVTWVASGTSDFFEAAAPTLHAHHDHVD
jgi:hypothetical protein